MSHSRHAAVGVYYRFYLVANKEMVMKGEIKMFGEGLEGLGKVGQRAVVNASSSHVTKVSSTPPYFYQEFVSITASRG